MLGLDFLPLAPAYNAAHALSQGRKAWWIALPTNSGGVTWADVTSGQQATLSSFASGFGWGGNPGPGQYQSLAFNSSGSNEIDCGSFDSLTGSAAATWAFSFLLTSSATGRVMTKWGGSGAAQCFDFEIITGPKFQIAFQNGGSFWIANTTAALSTSVWYRVAIVFLPSGGSKIYLNGSSAALTVTNAGIISSLASSTSHVQVGFESAESTASCAMRFNDFSVYPLRAFTAADAGVDFALAVQGWPGVLMQRRRLAVNAVASASVANVWLIKA